jgi:ribonuclease HI
MRVFTDGACSNNGKEGAKASYACWFPENQELSKAGRVPDDHPQTNQRAELMAIHEAIKIMQENFPADQLEIQIYTDSSYAKNCLTEWILTWISPECNWKNSKGGPVVHRDIIEDAFNRLSKFKSYMITWVKGHSGKNDELSKHNEKVDRMAVAVLDPSVMDAKLVHTNTAKPLEGLPIDIMGAPVTHHVLVNWCRENLDKLHDEDVDNALLTALTKTLKRHGFNLDKERKHRHNMYRLTANNLIVESTNVIKEE